MTLWMTNSVCWQRKDSWLALVDAPCSSLKLTPTTSNLQHRQFQLCVITTSALFLTRWRAFFHEILVLRLSVVRVCLLTGFIRDQTSSIGMCTNVSLQHNKNTPPPPPPPPTRKGEALFCSHLVIPFKIQL